MLSSHFKVPGVTITDIRKYFGVSNVKKLCQEAGVELYMLSEKRYAPLSNDDLYKLIRLIRSKQGARFLKSLENSSRKNRRPQGQSE